MNYFCTASYFCGNHHHGRLLNISLTAPKDFETIESFSELIPSPDILKYWKTSVKSYKEKKIDKAELDERWNNYSVSYQRSLHRRTGGIKLRLSRLIDAGKPFTLLCWEKPTAAIPNCHRNIAGEWLAENFDIKWYQDSESIEDLTKPEPTPSNKFGIYIPNLNLDLKDYLEQVRQSFKEKGFDVDFVPVPDDEDDPKATKQYVEQPWLFTVYVNGDSLGLWGKCGLPSIIHQIKKTRGLEV